MAMVALYRPGPMANIPDFISRKHNPALISYPDPRLTTILKNSYGILTFQDDVLLTTIALAGYTWLDADKFRKAMGKKIPSEMKKQRDIFLSGAVKNGLTQKKAEEIFELIAPFAGYGFNKAHAACYATIAFRTGYLKAHYPVEFMTALLTAESRGTTGPAKDEKIAQAVAECKRLHVVILPPSVNYSEAEFSIEANNVRFGLSAIKNVGTAAISSILEARKSGRFTSLSDFLEKVELSKVNKKTMESLIKAGALDEFGKRSALLSLYPEVAGKISREQKDKAKNQASLFDEVSDTISTSTQSMYVDMEEFSEKEKLMFEKELLGFFLTNHPLNEEIENLARFISHNIADLPEEQEGISLKIGGLLSSVKKIITKKSNQEMAFLTLEDHAGFSIECVVFPKIFEVSKAVLNRDAILIIEGKLQFKDERPVVIVDIVKRLTN